MHYKKTQLTSLSIPLHPTPAVTASARESTTGVTEALTFFQAENELDYLLALLATGKQPKGVEQGEEKAHGKGKTYIVFMDGPTSTFPGSAGIPVTNRTLPPQWAAEQDSPIPRR